MPPVRKGVYGPRGDRTREYTPQKYEYMKSWRDRNREKVNAYNRKSYRNRRFFWKKFVDLGITQEIFDDLLEKQDGKCAICLKPFTRTPHIDHRHKDGRIRGLLCNNCNTGIGKFSDDPDTLIRAAEFVRQP